MRSGLKANSIVNFQLERSQNFRSRCLLTPNNALCDCFWYENNIWFSRRSSVSQRLMVVCDKTNLSLRAYMIMFFSIFDEHVSHFDEVAVHRVFRLCLFIISAFKLVFALLVYLPCADLLKLGFDVPTSDSISISHTETQESCNIDTTIAILNQVSSDFFVYAILDQPGRGYLFSW